MPLFTALTRLKTDLDALPAAAPALAQLRQLRQVEWSYHSSAGATEALTLAEARALLLHERTAAGQSLPVQLALRHHYHAIRQVEALAQSRQPLTEQGLTALHATLLGQPPGTTSPYKTASNDLLTATGQVRYFSRPDDVPARLAVLLAWYRHAAAHPTRHPVALAAQLHHRFAAIRPFAAGNGRLARLLLNLALQQHGYPLVVVRAADEARYHAACAAAVAGAPEPFLAYLAELVAAALHQQLRAAQGETAGETDDLPAKLALLKQQVLSREDAVQTLWDTDVQATIYAALLAPWLADLRRQTQDFDDLFMSRGYGGSVEAALPLPLVLEEEGDWEAFEGHLGTAIAITQVEIQVVRCTTRWLHFRQRNNGFDVELRTDFHFHPDHLTVCQAVMSNCGGGTLRPHWQAEVLRTSYLPAYDALVLPDLNHQLATRLYDFIAAQALPPTPPAQATAQS